VALTGIAAEISVAINRAMAYELEHEVASTLQRSLLSFEVPHIAGWEIDTWHLPAHRQLMVGGDLFDVTHLDDGRFVVAVGDVVGHGLSAAASLGQLRSATKALSLGVSKPSILVEELDAVARLTPGVFAASICCAIIAPAGSNRFASAGHPYPILVRDGRATLLTGGRSSLLGVGVRARSDAEFEMAPNSSLVLYTDGVVERRGEDLTQGIERLRMLAENITFGDGSAAEVIATTMLSDRERSDDAVVVCVTRMPTGPA
jgi:serine phosphatase RsbU (regulator of sigma subunit)